MEEIICDPFFRGREDNPNGRFGKGKSMKVITIGGENLSSENTYLHRDLLCCAEVRGTSDNWFYIIPPEVLGKVRKWINEIKPHFPTLDMKIIRMKSDITDVVSYAIPHRINVFETDHKVSNEPISINIKMNSSHYGDRRCEIRQLRDMVSSFLDYCVENNLEISGKGMSTTIRKFIEENLVSIKEELNSVRAPSVILYKEEGSKYYMNSYAYSIMDTEDLTPDKLQGYLETVIRLNTEEYIPYVKERIDSKVGKYIFILRVLYSKRRFTIERYIAHILIRAAFSKELHPFIDQYYLIKSRLPEVYFWNLIFITQFGFDINPYYWLTGTRTFKFTTKEKFEEAMKGHGGNSSNYFFDSLFKNKMLVSLENNLSETYKRGDFKSFYKSMIKTVHVKPTEDFRLKSSSFKISDRYEVLLFDSDYYCVYNDEYNIKKCKKHNFIEV